MVVEWFSDDILDDMRKASVLAVNAVTIEFQTQIKKQLNKRSGPPASPPGTPPAKRTGTLGRSWQTGGLNFIKIISKTKLRYTQRVGSKLPYAPVHEFGGRFHPKRSYVSPAFLNTLVVKDEITAAIFRRALNE
jgi:phage gpG-like protein